MPPLVIRVDADEQIGYGHLTRCLALARAWAAPVVVATAQPAGEPPTGRILAAGAMPSVIVAPRGSTEDAQATAALARASGAEWVVVDGYHFDAAYQRALAAAGLRVLCIDDNGEAGDYACDIVLNQNLHADPALYAARGAATRLLLGPRFVLLRAEFLERGQPVRTFAPVASRILVTLGGGHAAAALLTVIEALAAVDLELDVTVVTGATPDGGARLRARASAIRGSVTLIERTDAMPDLMASAELAVSAGGSTSWELAYMGLPAAVVTMAPNQVGAVTALLERGIVADLGPDDRLEAGPVARVIGELARDAERRRRMSAAGQALVDGRGVSRVIDAVHSTSLTETQKPAAAGRTKDSK